MQSFVGFDGDSTESSVKNLIKKLTVKNFKIIGFFTFTLRVY